MAKKTITLDMLKSSLAKKKPDIAGMPFYQVAALLYQFDRAELEDLLQKHFKEELSDADFEALVQNCSAGDEPGRHILEDFERNKVIRRLDSDHALTGFDAIGAAISDPAAPASNASVNTVAGG